MDNEKKDGQDGKACCNTKKCCGGKGLAVLALLLVGGAGGYLTAKCCGDKASAAVEAPSAPVK